jgi:hypothetical protein
LQELGSSDAKAGEMNVAAGCNAREYCAYETVRTAEHFSCIARARSEKPKRQIDDDAKVQERPAGVEGDDADGAGDAQIEAAAARVQAGLAVVSGNTLIAHRFDDKTLADVVGYKTAERTDGFIRQLNETDFMSTGALPSPSSQAWQQQHRRDVNALTSRYQSLGTLDSALTETADGRMHVLALPLSTRRCAATRS